MSKASAWAGIGADLAGRVVAELENGTIGDSVLRRLLTTPGMVVDHEELAAVAGCSRAEVEGAIAELWDALAQRGVPGRRLIVLVKDVGALVPGSVAQQRRAALLRRSLLTFDRESSLVSWRGRTRRLSERRGALLEALLERSGRVVEHAELAAAAGVDRAALKSVIEGLRRDLAELLDAGVSGTQVIVSTGKVGFRLELPDPDDARFARLWGLELDLLQPRLRVNGREIVLTPAVGVVVKELIAGGGGPVSDATLVAAASDLIRDSRDLESLARGYGWLIERSGRSAWQLALERLTPGLVRARALSVYPPGGQAHYSGRELIVTPLQARVLASLVREPHRVLTHRELIAEHWGGFAHPSTLSATIAHLRAALGPEVIGNVGYVGYQLRITHPGRNANEVIERARQETLCAGPLSLDTVTRVLQRLDHGRVTLHRREATSITLLMRRAGRVVSDTELIGRLGLAPDSPRGYEAAIRVLREKLRLIDAEDFLIRVEERGYRLGCAVPGFVRVAELELDRVRSEVRLAGQPLEPMPALFRLLDRLAASPGHSVAPSELTACAWQEESADASLETRIPLVLSALGRSGAGLVQQTGAGYRLAVERAGLLAVGALVLDTTADYMRYGEREQQLYATESRALAALIQASGEARSRDELLEATGLRTPRALQACLMKLHNKLWALGYWPENAAPIEVIKRAGWRLTVEHLDPGLLDWPLRFEALYFRPSIRRVRAGDIFVTLEPKPAGILELLIAARGEVVTDQTLTETLWEQTPAPRILASYSQELQEALAQTGTAVRVERVRVTGYRLVSGRAASENES